MLLISCTASNNAEKQVPLSGTPCIEFATQSVNFGELQQGDVVAVKYWFTNTGTAPATISDIDTGCGCTKANFPQEPIRQGEKKCVELIFDTRGLYGMQNKTATVKTNGKQIKLTIIALIK